MREAGGRVGRYVLLSHSFPGRGAAGRPFRGPGGGGEPEGGGAALGVLLPPPNTAHTDCKDMFFLRART